jgi:hypothetical protein
VTGTTTITASNATGIAFIDSILSDNIFEGAFTINAGEQCVRSSTVDGNNFFSTLNLLVTDIAGDYALYNGVLSNNVIVSDLIMNNAGSTTATLVRESTIDSNEIRGSCTLGAGLSTTSVTNTFLDVTFTGNRIQGSVTLGPAGRTVDTTSYISSTFTDNVIGVTGSGDLTVRGAMVGCSFVGNTMNNNSDFDQISGGVMTSNVFGADASGTLDLNGGIISNGIFNSNFVVGALTVSGVSNVSFSSVTFEGNTLNGILDVDEDVTNTVFSGNKFGGSVDFDRDFEESVISNNKFSSTLNFGSTGTGVVSCIINGNT